MNLKLQLKNNKHLILSFFVLILIAIASLFNKQQSYDTKEKEPQIEIDTSIPKGYVLIPIELQNQEAIESVVTSYAIVNLMTGDPSKQISEKIATRIKMIRAPYNPHLFAVLVKENFAKNIMSKNGSLFAVIQNKFSEEGSNEIVTQENAPNISINYQN